MPTMRMRFSFEPHDGGTRMVTVTMFPSLEALEKDRGVSVSYLEYRRYVLQWLADRGCAGIRDLLFATHLKLKK